MNLRKKLMWLGIIVVNMISCQSNQETTMVYLVRHAEKNLDDTTDNPALTKSGEMRAQSLMKILQNEAITAVYTTKFQRNINTVAPIVKSKGIQAKLYEWNKWEPMVNKVLEDKKSTYLICGHSNNLLPIIAHLGVKTQLPPIGDNEYDNLFKVNINEDSTWLTIIKF